MIRLYFTSIILFLAYRAVVFYIVYLTNFAHVFSNHERSWKDFSLHVSYYFPEMIMAFTIIRFSIQNKNQDNSLNSSFKSSQPSKPPEYKESLANFSQSDAQSKISVS